MHVTLQSTQAAHSGRYGVLINVAKRFDQDWHAQVSLKGFTPPDTDHGYIFSFWGRAAADHPGGRAMPKVVFQDADDSYTPLKQVSVPLTSSWQMYEVDISVPKYRQGHAIIISFWVGEYAGSYALDDFQVDIVAPFLPPPPPPPRSNHGAPPPPGVVALLGFEGTDDGVTSQRAANNGSWVVSVPDARAAHSGGAGLYVEVSKAWKVASLARLLLPRYVPRAGKEMLLHLAFWARVEKMHSTDPDPSVTVAFLDLHKNYEEIGSETITIKHTDWQMHYVVIDLKTEHVGHSIRPYLYIGKDSGIYYFDEFEYKEIEIEDGMAWLQRAPERIRRRRMGKFRLTFYDADDWPIDYGTADVQLGRHFFSLGVDVKTRPMSSMAAADYLWYLRTAARHFWAGAIQQQMLWADYEPTPGDVSSGQKAVDDVITWSGSQNWGGISATLLDGGHDNHEHWSNKLACKDLKQRLHERIARDLSHFRGKIQLYEVWKGSLHWRDWIDRCGEGLFFDAYRWAQQADPTALLCSSEAAVLTTLTLTNAEAYHNLVYRLMDQGVPIKAVCVQAVFEGEIDASTVKHRLDVLNELRLPVYITEFKISVRCFPCPLPCPPSLAPREYAALSITPSLAFAADPLCCAVDHPVTRICSRPSPTPFPLMHRASTPPSTPTSSKSSCASPSRTRASRASRSATCGTDLPRPRRLARSPRDCTPPTSRPSPRPRASTTCGRMSGTRRFRRASPPTAPSSSTASTASTSTTSPLTTARRAMAPSSCMRPPTTTRRRRVSGAREARRARRRPSSSSATGKATCTCPCGRRPRPSHSYLCSACGRAGARRPSSATDGRATSDCRRSGREPPRGRRTLGEGRQRFRSGARGWSEARRRRGGPARRAAGAAEYVCEHVVAARG